MRTREKEYPPISEERRAIYMEKIKNFTLMDDDFMSKVFEDKACAEYLLHIILDREDLMVVQVQSQYTLKNLQGRSVRLDILATDANGDLYNIEVQRSDKGADALRARLYSSLLDANSTDIGEKFENIRETWVIFITENDVLGAGLPIYHIERTVVETGQQLGDKAHIIYVNSKVRNDTRLGRLMHDFHCKNVGDMTPSVLAERAYYFKENEEGSRSMCRAMEELILDEHKKIALEMLRNKEMSCEKIAMYFNLSLEEVQELAEEYGL